MKKFVLLVGVIALSACNQKSDEAPADTTAAAEAPAAPVAMEIDGKPMAGTFEITSADGKTMMMQTVNDDGTVVSIEGDKTTNGTWTSAGPGKFCITNEGETEPSCYTQAINPDGSMASTSDKDAKEIWTVKRVG